MNKEFNKDWFSNEIKFKKGNIPLLNCAKLIGISSATLSRVQNGKEPDLISYHKICAWLKMPMDKFFINYPQLNNIACPECGCELMDRDDGFSMSDPPKRNIKCSRCSYIGYRLACIIAVCLLALVSCDLKDHNHSPVIIEKYFDRAGVCLYYYEGLGYSEKYTSDSCSKYSVGDTIK